MTSPSANSEVAARERLEELFRTHEPAVVAYLRRRGAADAVDDLVAETFLVAWRRIDEVPSESLPWLLGVARRVLSTHRRGDGRRRNLSERLRDVTPPAFCSGSDGADRATTALARLSRKDQETLTLIAWEGLSPAQAAVVLGEPAGRVRVRLHRATRRMKALLDQEGSDPERPPNSQPFPDRQGASR